MVTVLVTWREQVGSLQAGCWGMSSRTCGWMFSLGHSCQEHSVCGLGSSFVWLQLRMERDAVQPSVTEPVLVGLFSQMPCKMLVLSKTSKCLLTRCFAGHLVLSKMSIRYLVHAKRSLKFGPVQNIHECIWSMPNGFGQDQISKDLLEWTEWLTDILDRTKWSSNYQGPIGLDQMSYGPNDLWIFWTGPNICQPQDIS